MVRERLLLLAWFVPLVVVLLGVQLTTGGSVSEGLIYTAFHAFFVLPTALLLGRRVAPARTTLEQISLGGPAAYGLLVIVSIVAQKLGTIRLAALVPLVSLVVLARSARRPVEAPPPSRAVFAGGIGLFLVTSGALFLLFAWPSREPLPGLDALHFQDNLWTLGNTRAVATWGLPLRDPHLSGVPLGYHVGQNVLHALTMGTTGIDPYGLFFRCEPFATLHLTVSALLWGSLAVLRTRPWVALATAALVLLSDGRSFGFSQMNYWNPISYAVSVAPFVGFFVVTFAWLDRRLERLPVGYLTSCFVLMGLTKGILLGFIPLALLGVVILRGVRDRQLPTRSEWALGAALLVATVFVMRTAFAASSPGYTLVSPFTTLPLVGALVAVGKTFVAEWFAFFLGAGPVMLLVAIVIVWPGARRALVRSRAAMLPLCFAIIVALSWSVVNLAGALVYFRWYPELALSLCLLLIEVPEPLTPRWTLAPIALAALWGPATFVRHSQQILHLWAMPPLAGRVPWSLNASLDLGEWEACRWLAQHASPTDVYFSDRETLRPPNRDSEASVFYGYTALTGLAAYAEGTHFLPKPGVVEADARWVKIRRFLAARDPVTAAKELGEIPARWYLQSLRFDRADRGATPGLVLRHENASMRIYEIVR